jgi:hypothetical protein
MHIGPFHIHIQYCHGLFVNMQFRSVVQHRINIVVSLVNMQFCSIVRHLDHRKEIIAFYKLFFLVGRSFRDQWSMAKLNYYKVMLY